jgi:hypothetical protein
LRCLARAIDFALPLRVARNWAELAKKLEKQADTATTRVYALRTPPVATISGQWHTACPLAIPPHGMAATADETEDRRRLPVSETIAGEG